MSSIELNQKDKQSILKVARHSIQYGLTYQRPPVLELETYSQHLQEIAASFVTLKETNKLRGCIGTLEAYQPLIQDVAEHAYAAAFNDPRFPPVNAIEEPMLHISISILSSPEPMNFESESDLLSQIKPGEDGLVLEYHNRKGTFLPSVWAQIHSSDEFLRSLKLKAGLSEDFWSDEISVKRYGTIVID